MLEQDYLYIQWSSHSSTTIIFINFKSLILSDDERINWYDLTSDL